MSNQSKKYIDLISRDDKDVKKDELQLHVDSAKLAIQADIIKCKRAVSAAETVLAKICSTIPFVPSNYVEASRELKEASEDLAALNAIEQELF